MTHRPAISMLCLALLIISAAVRGNSGQPVIHEKVQEMVTRSAGESFAEVLLIFDDDLDLTSLKIDRYRCKFNRKDNYREVIRKLARNRETLESSIKPILTGMKESGKIESFRFFTVSKIALVKTRVDNLDNLARLPGLRLVNPNTRVSLIKPVEEYDSPVFAKATEVSTALEAVNIRSLWNQGLNGNGTLICSFDTGVDGDHPALAPRWRGNNGASSEASWFAPHGNDVPADATGHGTHVMGIMVGGTDQDTIGIAYSAQWISAAVIDQGADFNTTMADILAAFDWALNPDGNTSTVDDVPDVICNSWGVPKGVFDACDDIFWNAIDNVEAAGIVTIFAAGNEGPTEGSIRNPADRAGSPINTLSVGAVDAATLAIADFSSRGPSGCDGSTKPELVAPGVGIYSTYKNDSYKIMSGTSMAAPFVAGLVALIRQYNPEATVEEIKYALLASTTDLGPEGEDNSYGQGLIDASRMLDYISSPSRPPIQVYSHAISSGGDRFADPGEMADLYLTLNDPSGLTDSVAVWLTSASDKISIVPNTISFHFATGARYAVSLMPFNILILPDAVSGQEVELDVHVRYPAGNDIETLAYSITIGRPLPGSIFAAGSGEISFTVSDFGQFGFGPGSIYQAGGEGFRFRGGDNLLYEAGLVIGHSEQQISDAIRDDDAAFKETDFVPNLAVAVTEYDEILDLGYTDGGAVAPIPIEVRHTVHRGPNDFIILEFDVKNPTPDRIDPLSIGLFCDFDIDRQSDMVGFDSMLEMLYQYNPETGVYIGMLGLSANPFAYVAATNDPAGKSGFDRQQKFELINRTGVNIENADAGDWYFAVSHTALKVEGFAHKKIALAFLVASDLETLRGLALAAADEYELILDAGDYYLAMPDKIKLYQNYPNPFNPTTTIGFFIDAAQRVNFAVYNIAGQKVRTLLDADLTAGQHDVIWDGTDENGKAVATGVYFYRLVTERGFASRKMILLK